MCLPTSSFGFNMKFGYFFMRNFFIRGCFKLCVVDFDEFCSFFLPTSMVLRFC
jgi:hypothetical protein